MTKCWHDLLWDDNIQTNNSIENLLHLIPTIIYSSDLVVEHYLTDLLALNCFDISQK